MEITITEVDLMVAEMISIVIKEGELGHLHNHQERSDVQHYRKKSLKILKGKK